MKNPHTLLPALLMFLCLTGARAQTGFSSSRVSLAESVAENDPSSIPGNPSGAIRYPSQVLDLDNWKITLPVDSENQADHPLEIRQPKLKTYQLNPWFTVTPDGNGVVFRASVVGPTTGGSKYARSELREMTDEGSARASWSSTQGSHTMLIDQAITATPKKKQEVVAGQIHDASRYIIFIRLEGSKLFVSVNGKNVCTLDERYVLGTRFTIKYEVREGKTAVYYNGSASPVFVLAQDYAGAYFKAGAYTQSNCKTEGDSSLCNPDNYGEVIIYRLQVSHTK
jgi:hypothetical protein